MEEQFTEQPSFYFVVEWDEDCNRFDCDKDLNRIESVLIPRKSRRVTVT